MNKNLKVPLALYSHSIFRNLTHTIDNSPASVILFLKHKRNYKITMTVKSRIGVLHMGNKELEAIFVKHGFNDFKWIKPEKIIVNQWVRMKCMFGCPAYGKKACCPPNMPSISECKNFFNEYKEGVIFHIPKKISHKEEYPAWSNEVNTNLCNIERDIFLSGYYKALVTFVNPCSICKECKSEKADCVNSSRVRPTPEAFGIDVYATARLYDFPIDVLTDYEQTMNRYTFLLVE